MLPTVSIIVFYCVLLGIPHTLLQQSEILDCELKRTIRHGVFMALGISWIHVLFYQLCREHSTNWTFIQGVYIGTYYMNRVYAVPWTGWAFFMPLVHTCCETRLHIVSVCTFFSEWNGGTKRTAHAWASLKISALDGSALPLCSIWLRNASY